MSFIALDYIELMDISLSVVRPKKTTHERRSGKTATALYFIRGLAVDNIWTVFGEQPGNLCIEFDVREVPWFFERSLCFVWNVRRGC
jgi:hypothetical protein